jgi:hypothetical protein
VRTRHFFQSLATHTWRLCLWFRSLSFSQTNFKSHVTLNKSSASGWNSWNTLFSLIPNFKSATYLQKDASKKLTYLKTKHSFQKLVLNQSLPLRIIIIIHFISCVFVLFIKAASTAVFSPLIIKSSKITNSNTSST